MNPAEPVFDPDGLARALARINRGRSREPGDPARTADLLSGLEDLLEAERPGRAVRDAGGGAALAELDDILRAAGSEDGAESLRTWLEPILDRLVEALLDRPERRLAAYGSLRPGEDNHHHLSRLVGRWTEGTVEGARHERGRGAAHGYPGLVYRRGDPPVPVSVFESAALADHWPRLDAFEGEEYRRILVPVRMAGTTKVANLYAVDAPAETGGSGEGEAAG